LLFEAGGRTPPGVSLQAAVLAHLEIGAVLEDDARRALRAGDDVLLREARQESTKIVRSVRSEHAEHVAHHGLGVADQRHREPPQFGATTAKTAQGAEQKMRTRQDA